MTASWRICRGTALYCLLGVLVLLGTSGCSRLHSGKARQVQLGESVVLIGEEPAQLAFAPVASRPLNVRSTYLQSPQTIPYEAGRDYIIDFDSGSIRRTRQSRIPDFRTNMLYGVEKFDHSKFPGFGNGQFFTFVDYSYAGQKDWPRQPAQTHFLPRTLEKLQRGEKLKIVAFGDSITAGGDATEPRLIFWKRWADHLRAKYPRATIQVINGATGGDTTRQGIERLSEKVFLEKPDLVLIVFGMNDHNIGGFGTPLEAFTNNLGVMIDRIRSETTAEIVLLSTFPPNPKWHYGSQKMAAYAGATEAVAHQKQCAYADIYRNWIAIASRKKPEDLLGNNINHPNDFGHWIYFAVLAQIGL